MNLRVLVQRSLRFYWRTHVGVVLGSAVATAILVGALAVGDSVRHTLRGLAVSRLGRVELAVVPRDRFFGSGLAEGLARELRTPVAAALVLDGSIKLLPRPGTRSLSAPGTERRGPRPLGRGEKANTDLRVNRVQVLGVDEGFWALSPRGRTPPDWPDLGSDEVLVNEALAAKLRLRPGDWVTVKVARPGLLSRDAPLSGSARNFTVVTAKVRRAVGADDFGRFDLRANQVALFSVYVPLDRLGEEIKLGTPAATPTRKPARQRRAREATLAGKANTLLIAKPGADQPLSPEAADGALRRLWRVEDADLQVRELARRGVVELRTGRVFLDEPVALAAAKVPGGMGVLTYLASEIHLGERRTPYSMVSALGPWPDRPAGPAGAGAPVPPSFAIVPADLRDDEIVINDWLADDLGADRGSEITLTYFVLAPGRTFAPKHRTFTVRKIHKLSEASAERELMPDFPDLSNTTNCADWDPGLPAEEIRAMKKKIRPDKDQKYWEVFRGTPKAFVTLRAGQEMWTNRFGNLTAVRWALSAQSRASIESAVRERVEPAQTGVFFQPVGSRARAAGTEALDFGPLFLGLSMFLIAAALILTGLLFAFNVQQRTEEVGTLLALGFRPGRVRWLLLAEGGALAVAGAVLGAPLGLAYTRVVLRGLATVWQGAVAGSAIRFHADPLRVVLGAACGVAVAAGAILAVLVRQARRPARVLLAGGEAEGASGRRGTILAAIVAGACGAAAVAAVVYAALAGEGAQVAMFFAAGGLLLAATVAGARVLLAAAGAKAGGGKLSLAFLGLRNATRRGGRSLAVVGLLACGTFLMIAVAANRRGPLRDVREASSPSGGFALYAESSVGILHDLNTPAGRKELRLDPADLAGVRVVPGRLLEGDDASCLNLNRAQVPRLIGLEPEALRARGAFRFVRTLGGRARDDPWSLLAAKQGDGAVPAVADQGTLQWALGKKVGDELTYYDERGRAFQVRVVGALENSIFQGSLLIDEEQFRARFPSEAGHRVFLIDAPPGRTAKVEAALSARLESFGFQATPTSQRLAAFNEVENAYLAIFQALGALGLLLGSAGLALVVLRNVLERRRELALMRAVGFSRGRLRTMILYEHWGLLAGGLVCGVVSAAVAVYPALVSAGHDVPYGSLAWTLVAVAAGGVLWTVLAAVVALRGELLPALRNE